MVVWIIANVMRYLLKEYSLGERVMELEMEIDIEIAIAIRVEIEMDRSNG